MKHLTVQESFGKTTAEVAEIIGNLRYDEAATLMTALVGKFERDAEADRARSRPKLATRLYCTAAFLNAAAGECLTAWQISEPFMAERENHPEESG